MRKWSFAFLKVQAPLTAPESLSKVCVSSTSSSASSSCVRLWKHSWKVPPRRSAMLYDTATSSPSAARWKAMRTSTTSGPMSSAPWSAR